MSNRDSDSQPFRRRTQVSSSGQKSESSGYKTPGKKDSDDTPVTTGRGRFLAVVQKAAEPQEVVSSIGSAQPKGRGKLFSVVKSSEQSTGTSSDEQQRQQSSLSSDQRPVPSGRGKFLSMLKPSQEPQDQPPAEPVQRTSGRGILLSMVKRPTPQVPLDEATSVQEVASTSDALAKLRLARSDGSTSKSCGSQEQATIPTLAQLELEAAPFDEVVQDVLQPKTGTHGSRIPALTNFIRLQTEPNKGVFEYETRFEPPIHSNQLRYALMKQQHSVIGQTKTFDGVKLCLPHQLPDRVTQLKGINPNDNSDVTISIIYKGRRKFAECQQFYGILFQNIMKTLKFVQFGRKDFDPTQPKVIPQHKLEIWPGFVTAVEECYDGVMLCVDVTHRVLRQTPVLEILQHAFRNSRGEDFKTKVAQALIGAMVLTRYNNKTYRIDDIDWDQTPENKFETKNGEISYIQYYKQQYNIDIKDRKQPLLISREEKRVSGQKEKQTFIFSIIPEISYLTGLTDEQRADFKVMRDVATYTRISPNQRANELVQYCKRVNNCPETKQLLSNWGLKLMDNAVEVEARQMDEEQIIFAKKTFGVGPNADFGKYSTNNELMAVVSLHNWLVIHVKNDTKAAKSFLDNMERNSRPMGITVSKPNVIVLDNDKTETYAQTLRQALNVQTQIVVCICPTSRDDRYATIKKICCAESPIPSQVINARTLSNDAKNRSIVQKIALQMNCKMGGSLWSIKIPLSNCMIIGIDTYHDKKSGSVSAFVASTNDTFTNWYSKAVVQNKNEELVHGLVVSLQFALKHYRKVNNQLPRKIIIFRDGVGDGQLKAVKDYELAQMKQACTNFAEDYKPPFTFLVVQKRVNARFYLVKGPEVTNPNPGAILDHTITRRGLYDFYLVPQSVRQGTVTPTHCVVVEDESSFPPDVLQRLTYKLCFLYYNWPGTVRVPACCQYAHKLAYLVGQSLKREPAEQLNDRLFYI